MIKEKTDKFNKSQTTDWEKIFSNYVSENGCRFRLPK